MAEGVETEWQLQRLRSLGCEYVQGYHLCRPIAAPDIDTYLQQHLPAREQPDRAPARQASRIAKRRQANARV
ncbi:MAG TPA: EAL domain-containing protein [Solirubrobacteraceae bacterium]|nr:EAL domain-containing protein [Solirubrobacteraceae bacterium]